MSAKNSLGQQYVQGLLESCHVPGLPPLGVLTDTIDVPHPMTGCELAGCPPDNANWGGGGGGATP